MSEHMERDDTADYTAVFSDLMTLLDRIEQITEDELIHRLCHERFVIAEKHGFTLEIIGPTTGLVQ